MKTFYYTGVLALTFILLLTASQCNKTNPPPSIQQFSYTKPIVNPPDTFQVIFNISTLGDKYAKITFLNDGVWLIEKLGDSRINFRIENGTDVYAITRADTLGLKGGFEYSLVANNNNYMEFNNFFTQFTRLSLDYNTFQNKFK